MTGPAEQTLVGGTANRGLVVRIGDTVRRPIRAEAPATHALLAHLEAVGFDGAPRLLGIDDQGREVLSYVEGETPLPPYPAWALTDDALESVAVLMRSFHDATTGFGGTERPWSAPLPAEFRSGGVICHNDPNLDNVVFRGGRAVALIDFDLAAPGTRLWDVASAVRLWSPLRSDEDIADARLGYVLERAGRFVTAYGLGQEDRAGLVDTVLASHDWCYRIVAAGAESGHAHFGPYWDEGGAERAARSRNWIVRHCGMIEDAVR